MNDNNTRSLVTKAFRRSDKLRYLKIDLLESAGLVPAEKECRYPAYTYISHDRIMMGKTDTYKQWLEGIYVLYTDRA